MRTKLTCVFTASLLALTMGVTPLTALAEGAGAGPGFQVQATQVFTDSNTQIEFQGGDYFVYNGVKQEPAILNVRLNGNRVDSKYYTVTYGENNTDAGDQTGTVTVTGKNGYSGTYTRRFTINKCPMRDVLIEFEDGYVYNGNEIKPKPSVSFNGVDLSETSDYSVDYPADSRTKGTYRATINALDTSKNFTSSTNAVYTIVPQMIDNGSMLFTPRSTTYTGNPVDPGVRVEVNGMPLTRGDDYDLKIVSWNTGEEVTEPKDAGTYSVVATGKGNHKGEVVGTFTIGRANISDAMMNVSPTSYAYDGNAKRPTINATYNGKSLAPGTDYDPAYYNNTEPGSALAMIIGTGNFTGAKTAPFTIASSGNGTGDNGSGNTGSGTGDNGTGTGNSGTGTGNNGNGSGNNGTGNNGTGANGSGDSGNGSGVQGNNGSGSGDGASGNGTSGANGNGSGESADGGSGTSGNGGSGADGGNGTSGANGSTGTDGTTGTSAGGSSTKADTTSGTSVASEDASSSKKVRMYRLYNPNSGEHFYTSDASERNHLIKVGWNYEGIGWKAPASSDVPVYRLYNSNEPLGDHHYTADSKEVTTLVDAGWTYEGVGWYSDDKENINVYRQYNPNAYLTGLTGAHNYTTNKAENDHLARVGWYPEGISWYGVS